MPPKDFECKQCGNCCLNLTDAICTCVSEEDVQRWHAGEREDILEWVVPIGLGHLCVHDIWISPRTGDSVSRCPWLRKVRGKDTYICRIQDTKPEHCRTYPLSRKHAEETGCRGFEK
jgi:Fe-S-cluster containining protein